MKKLFVIFVNFNSGDQLFNGLNAVLKSKSVYGAIVVDNNSKDGSIEMISQVKSKKEVIVIKNSKNLGFYKALNTAVKKALKLGADMVMPLDFDLDFTFDFISEVLKSNADVVAPALKLKRNGKWLYDYGGRINWITGKATHIVTTKKLNIGEIISSKDHTGSNWFDFISGGCTIIKKEVFKKNGFFDEDYFVYWGDADYALQAREHGFKVAMYGKTTVHHKLEITSETKNFRKMKIAFYDNLTFIRKRVKWYFKPIAYSNVLLKTLVVLLRTFLNFPQAI